MFWKGFVNLLELLWLNYTILFVVIQGVLERVCKSSIAIMVELYDPARCNTGCSGKFFVNLVELLWLNYTILFVVIQGVLESFL